MSFSFPLANTEVNEEIGHVEEEGVEKEGEEVKAGVSVCLLNRLMSDFIVS